MDLFAHRSLTGIFSSAVILFIVSGCGDHRVRTYPVEMSVKYKGTQETIPGGGVELQPKNPLDREHRVSCVGRILANGTVVFTTFKPGDGAVEGVHRGMLYEPGIPHNWDIESQGPPPPTIPARYKTFATSDLTIEVTPGGENHLDIEIEKPQAPRR